MKMVLLIRILAAFTDSLIRLFLSLHDTDLRNFLQAVLKAAQQIANLKCAHSPTSR